MEASSTSDGFLPAIEVKEKHLAAIWQLYCICKSRWLQRHSGNSYTLTHQHPSALQDNLQNPHLLYVKTYRHKWQHKEVTSWDTMLNSCSNFNRAGFLLPSWYQGYLSWNVCFHTTTIQAHFPKQHSSQFSKPNFNKFWKWFTMTLLKQGMLFWFSYITNTHTVLNHREVQREEWFTSPLHNNNTRAQVAAENSNK